MLKSVTLLALVGVIVSGCGSAPAEPAVAEDDLLPAVSSSPNQSSDIKPDQTVADSRDLSAYFIPDAVSFSRSERLEVLTAYALLVRDCVDANGLKVEVSLPDAAIAQEAAELRSLAFFFDDLDSLIEVGYGGLTDGHRLTTESEPSLSNEPTGDEAGAYAACHQDARVRLNGGKSTPSGNVPPAAYDAESAMNVDMLRALQPETELWSKCMEAAGFPESKVNYPPTGAEQSPVAERAAIEADFRCRLESGYTEALLRYRGDRVAQFLRDDAAALADQRIELNNELAAALQVLDEHGVSHE